MLNKSQLVLNVGGQLFSTSRDQIARGCDESLLYSNFCRNDTNAVPTIKEIQTFFIDRSPAVFKHVLDYVNMSPSGTLALEKLNNEDLDLLALDAEFYKLSALSESIVFHREWWASCAATNHRLPVPSPQYPTIQAAVDAANDNDIIVLAGQVYRESVRITSFGCLTIEGVAGKTTIKSNHNAISSSGGDLKLRNLKLDGSVRLTSHLTRNVIIEGCNISPVVKYGNACGIHNLGQNTSIFLTNTAIHFFTMAVITNGTSINVKSCLFHSCRNSLFCSNGKCTIVDSVLAHDPIDDPRGITVSKSVDLRLTSCALNELFFWSPYTDKREPGVIYDKRNCKTVWQRDINAISRKLLTESGIHARPPSDFSPQICFGTCLILAIGLAFLTLLILLIKRNK